MCDYSSNIKDIRKEDMVRGKIGNACRFKK
jgi:hypothetical protein